MRFLRLAFGQGLLGLRAEGVNRVWVLKEG
jgi:hypothetical protein